MAVLTVQQIAATGLNPTFGAAAGGGDSFAGDERTFLVVKNGGGSPITVTPKLRARAFSPTTGVQATVNGEAVSVTNAQERWIGPFAKGYFTGEVAYSGVTTVTVAAVRL